MRERERERKRERQKGKRERKSEREKEGEGEERGRWKGGEKERETSVPLSRPKGAVPLTSLGGRQLTNPCLAYYVYISVSSVEHAQFKLVWPKCELCPFWFPFAFLDAFSNIVFLFCLKNSQWPRTLSMCNWNPKQA